MYNIDEFVNLLDDSQLIIVNTSEEEKKELFDDKTLEKISKFAENKEMLELLDKMTELSSDDIQRLTQIVNILNDKE